MHFPDILNADNETPEKTGGFYACTFYRPEYFEE